MGGSHTIFEDQMLWTRDRRQTKYVPILVLDHPLVLYCYGIHIPYTAVVLSILGFILISQIL